MIETKAIPEELLEQLQPQEEQPEPIRLPREAWRSLITRGFCETPTHVYIWSATAVTRLARIWIGHPDNWRHWEDVIIFTEGGDNK